MKHSILIAGLILASLGTGASGMDGKAVTAVYTTLQWWDWPGQPAIHSRLVVATTSSNAVTKTDTLLSGGPFYHPTWSFDGTRIAFYMRGHGLSVVNANGTGLRTVAMTGDWNEEGTDGIEIAWPGADRGKWIYYLRPDGKDEVWKVNVDDTAQKVMVVNYSPNCDDGMIYRFALSADAKYAATHMYSTTNDCYGYQPNVTPHTFPPQGSPSSPNPHSTEPRCSAAECQYAGDCNSALSASGSVFYHFRGSHAQLYAHYWDHTNNTIGGFWKIGSGNAGELDLWGDVETWLAPGSPDVGSVFIYPRGSSNSDQIITVICAYRYGAEYTHNCDGSNMAVVNWKDKGAIMATNNPNMNNPNGGGIPGGTLWNRVEPGDFWLQPPADKMGCYEDVNGSWIAVEGAVGAINRQQRSTQTGVSLTSHNVVTVYDLKGARAGTSDPRKFAQNIASHNVYVVTDRMSGQPGRTRMVVGGLRAH